MVSMLVDEQSGVDDNGSGRRKQASKREWKWGEETGVAVSDAGGGCMEGGGRERERGRDTVVSKAYGRRVGAVLVACDFSVVGGVSNGLMTPRAD